MKKYNYNYFESGTRLSSLVKEFNMPGTIIGSIIKIKVYIKLAEVAQCVILLTFKRLPLLKQMEKLLLVWKTEKRVAGDGR